ncbi:MAG: hypothetical protein ABIZ34_07845 [Candidatus Limnocylindrales bacterium]
MNRDADLALLLIDGDNLLHRLRGGRDESGLAWLIPRLRASLPPRCTAIVMLDGHPDRGQPPVRQATPGVEFRHSLRLDADTAIIEILSARPFVDRARTVVVTDDRALTERARHVGGVTRRLDWLRGRLDAPAAAARIVGGTLGVGVPPKVGPASAGQDEERRRWTPGRGATRKRGNPRRGRPA